MARPSKGNHLTFVMIVGLLAWLVPGAGHLVLGEIKRSVIMFVTVVLTFCAGIYVGSIGVVDPVGATPWYVAQVMNSPIVAALGFVTWTGAYRVYGWPNEIGQIYTSTGGLLNLLCIVNAVYLAHIRSTETSGG